MKHFSRTLTVLLTVLTMAHVAWAQQPTKSYRLGTTQTFLDQLNQQAGGNVNGRTAGASAMTVQVSAKKAFSLQVNVQRSEGNDGLTLMGSVIGEPDGSFYIHVDGDDLSGHILLRQQGAYRYFTDGQGNAFVKEEEVDEILCTEYPKGPERAEAQASDQEAPVVAQALYSLQSLPGAATCVLLDFDGQYVVGTPWEKGRAINAAPAGMSDGEIQELWELVSEDFRAFNVNITTNEGVFNQYAGNRRMRCIITPTNFTNGAGGVAFVRSFAWDDDVPCWVFMPRPKAGGEAASHEIGHTLGLSHDGRTSPEEGYYRGHGDWAPIMGVGYYEPISQWSRGEYNSANNREDDLAIMERYIPYRRDDHSNGFQGATTVGISGNGRVDEKTGVIERTGDQDFFRFTCGTGDVQLDINTVGRYGNLDVLVRLYEGRSGNQIGTFNGNGLNTRLNAYLDAGEYFIGVDGTGAGNPATNGYSDYASLGSFRISGTAPAGNGGSNPVTLYFDCDYQGITAGLTEGSYTMTDLAALGMPNDKVSSLRVQNGYRVTMYFDDNFQGRTLVKTGDDNCLAGEDNFNDQLSSIRVSRTNSNSSSNSVARIEAEDYSEMNGIQVEDGAEGKNVGYIDQGDWLVFNNINFPRSGDYKIEYRVASPQAGGRLSLDLNAGAQVLGEVSIPNTGGWQNWTTVSQTARVNAGTHSLGIYASTPNWNINWIRITPVGNAALARTGDVAKGSSTAEALASPLPNEVIVYPNPVVAQMRISVPSREWEDSRMSIINALGQRVWEGDFQQTLDMSQYETGIYSVLLNKSGKHLVRRIIKE